MDKQFAGVNDTQVTTFARKPNGQIEPGFSSHPLPGNEQKRVKRLIQSVRNPKHDGGRQDVKDRIQFWKDKEWEIWVKAGNRNAVLAWAPEEKNHG